MAENTNMSDPGTAAAQLVSVLQQLVIKVGLILQSMGGATGFYAIKTITVANSPYVPTDIDEFLLADATGGAVTITMSALSNPQISVKKIDASANAVTVNGTIDNAGSVTSSTQYKSWNFKRDASNKWWLF